MGGGGHFHHLLRGQRSNEDGSNFYGAGLLLASERPRDLGVVYGEENALLLETGLICSPVGSGTESVLLDYIGHVALCDFELCKLKMEDSKMANAFCGISEYLVLKFPICRG